MQWWEETRCMWELAYNLSVWECVFSSGSQSSVCLWLWSFWKGNPNALAGSSSFIVLRLSNSLNVYMRQQAPNYAFFPTLLPIHHHISISYTQFFNCSSHLPLIPNIYASFVYIIFFLYSMCFTSCQIDKCFVVEQLSRTNRFIL